jgi:hypothetical protein
MGSLQHAESVRHASPRLLQGCEPFENGGGEGCALVGIGVSPAFRSAAVRESFAVVRQSSEVMIRVGRVLKESALARKLHSMACASVSRA